MADKKFDQFTDGGEMQVGDIPVGLRSSDLTKNFKFDFPGAGIKDSSGNYLFQYATAGAAAVNYPKLINSASTLPVQLTAEGSDSNINISLTPKGTGILVFDGLSWPSADGTANQAIITNGLGILSFGNVPIVTVPTTDNAIARFNGTGGALQNSGVIISDSNAVSGMTRLDVGAIRVESDTISGIGINASIVLSPGGLGVVSANRLKLATDMDTNGFAITTSVINGDILITPNGNGDTVFTNNLEVATANGIQDSNDNLYLQFQSIGAGANNYFIVKNGDNSFAPMLQVAGTPTNLDLSLQTKGTGNYVLLATSVLSSRLQFRELTTNGLGRVTVSAPNAVPVNWVFTLPDAAPSTTSQYLTATTGGISSWSTIPGSDITGNALTKTDDTNVTLTLGGNPTTALLRATSLTLGWTGQLGLTRGGTNASLTASNGGLIYSTATAMSVLAGTATANRVPLSGSSAAPSWSTATYPATTTINQLLYSSAANTITGLATGNSSILVTSAGGVPSLSTTLPAFTAGGLITATAAGINLTSGGGNLSYYAQNLTFVPAITFVTPGDLSVVYTQQTGIYTRTGNVVDYYIDLRFTPTYTTATGQFQITNMPFAAMVVTGGIGFGGIVVNNSNALTFTAGYTQIDSRVNSGLAILQIRQIGSGLNSGSLGVANIPSGGVQNMIIYGSYFV